MPEEKVERGQYPFSRSFHASARLQLQHLLWNIRLGYLVHPSIRTDSTQPLRIADVCTGNGLWLLELSRQLPSNAELHGFDISPKMFPAKEWLPTNVHLNIIDVLGSEFPEGLEGSFDVVHVRALSLVVKQNEPSDLLRKLSLLLKPSGYLQWDEIDIGSYRAETPDSSVLCTASDQLVRYVADYMEDQGIRFQWIRELPTYFQSAELEVIHTATLPTDNALRKFETDNFLMASEDLLSKIGQQIARRDDIDANETESHLMKLFQDVVRECEKGCSLIMDWSIAVGRKP